MEMESNVGRKQGLAEQIPSLFSRLTISKAIVGFDSTSSPSPIRSPIPTSRFAKDLSNKETGKRKWLKIGYGSSSVIKITGGSSDGYPSVDLHPMVPGVANADGRAVAISMLPPAAPSGPLESHHHRTVSVSLPSSPSCLNVDEHPNRPPAASVQPHMSNIFHSQPLQSKLSQANVASPAVEHRRMSLSRQSRLKDKRFDSFKTWSGKLERQISNLRGMPQEPEEFGEEIEAAEPGAIPAVDRYYESLEGPELETLKSSEELVLPGDKKWPFLLRFPISSFGMCLGMSSQAILWKTLAQSESMSFLRVSPTVNLVLWCISLVLLAAVALVYALKIVFYFEAVKREYYHPVRVNFFFAPWIACLFLAIGVPPQVAIHLHVSLWYLLMSPILCLELKIYGQWMSGGQRRLSKVANPSNHLSIVGNFVGALLGASMGLTEGPIFFYAVGLAHYSVLFVTLYQRLPTNETLPKELHPVFFLFVAAPSVACVAWAKISGDFGYPSRIAYFVALFLYISLAVRINFFRGFRFSLAWWAYTFPMTGAAIATIRYAGEVNNWFTESMSVVLSAISTVTVSALLVSTVLHAFVFHDLFPNDISIAIKEKGRSSKKHSHKRTLSSSDIKNVEDLSPV